MIKSKHRSNAVFHEMQKTGYKGAGVGGRHRIDFSGKGAKGFSGSKGHGDSMGSMDSITSKAPKAAPKDHAGHMGSKGMAMGAKGSMGMGASLKPAEDLDAPPAGDGLSAGFPAGQPSMPGDMEPDHMGDLAEHAMDLNRVAFNIGKKVHEMRRMGLR